MTYEERIDAIHGSYIRDFSYLKMKGIAKEADKETSELKADIQFMIDKSAAKHLSAYREQGHKNLSLQSENEELKANIKKLKEHIREGFEPAKTKDEIEKYEQDSMAILREVKE